MRLLIASTLDSKEPFGAFTRPYYLGKYLSEYFEVCQLGLDCSAIDYAETVSVGERGLGVYRRALRECVDTFQPDIIYAQETLPAIASLLSVGARGKNRPSLVFDFHTLSAFEYWTRLRSTSNRFQELRQFIKTYIAQGILLLSGNPIIAASQQVADLAAKWYPIKNSPIHAVGNGVPEDLLQLSELSTPDPYTSLRPAKVVVIVAPKTFSFPTNDMSVDMTLQIAKYLEGKSQEIHFVIVGRDSDDTEYSLLPNVTFAGFLPSRKDFLAHLHHADIALLPFSKQAVAGGARNKSLDFLASQNLVISTPEGIRGLEEFQHKKHLLVTDYAIESIADAIFNACIQLECYKPIADAATALVQAKYSWESMATRIAEHLTHKSPQS